MRWNVKNIVLTGLPACGKTTLGKRLAEEMGMIFVDADAYLEESTGLSASNLLRGFGEENFRRHETVSLKRLSNVGGAVIATGGGAVLREENMCALSLTGVIVFLDVAPAEIEKRPDCRLERPLFTDIETLDRERRPLYEKTMHYRARNYEDLLRIAKTVYTPKKFCVIGNPVEHSLSPQIHEPVLNRLCNRAEYYKQQICDIKHLKEWINSVKDGKMRIAGFNVTAPYKQTVIPFLDEVHTGCGAVNTVVVRDGKMIGYNTDGAGFAMAYKPQGKVVLIGSGGAAKAIAAEIGGLCETVLVSRADFHRLPVLCERADMVVNCTPLGAVSDFEDLSFLKKLPPFARVIDLLYHPAETVFLKEARSLDFKSQNGFEMLIFQAILAQKHFLDADFDVKEMYDKVLLHIKNEKSVKKSCVFQGNNV